MRVLITRPAEDAERTADALRAAGHEPILAPIFAIKPLVHDVPAGIDALIATSANALRQAQLGDVSKATPVFTVGDSTAAEARRIGLSNVVSANGDSRDLAELLRLRLPPGAKLAWLAGLHRRDEAFSALAASFQIAVIETYENTAMDALPRVAGKAISNGQVEAVLHFSKRSQHVFTKLTVQAGLQAQAQRILHVFISEAAVDPAYPLRRIAAQPELQAMVEALSSP